MRTILLALLLSGCSTIHTYVDGWPQDMKVTHRYVSFGDVMDTCYKYLTTLDKLMLGVPLACAEIDLGKNTCDITMMETPGEYILEHEEAHCKGGDHDGILQGLFDNWKTSRP